MHILPVINFAILIKSQSNKNQQYLPTANANINNNTKKLPAVWRYECGTKCIIIHK